MTLQLADDTASALADLITTRADAGSGAPQVKVYTGTLPTDLAPGTETLLATFTLNDPGAAAAAAGVADWDFATAVTATVAADGEAGWFRLEDSTGVAVLGGTCGRDGELMNFSSTSWVAGGTVSLTSGTVAQPDAG